MARSATEPKIDYRLNLFLNPGIRYYLSKMFFYDYTLRTDLDLAGYMADKRNLEKKIVDMEKASDKSSDKMLNDLARNLNHIKENITGTTDKTWKEFEKNFLKHFNQHTKIGSVNFSNMRIHEFQKGQAIKIGYTYNHENRELRYYDGRTSDRTVCQFSPEQDNALKEIFPSLFNNKIGTMKKNMGLRRSAPINANQFIKLLTIGKAANKMAQFHMDVDKSVIDLFNNVKERQRLQVLQEKVSDPRIETTLAQAIIARIKNHITTTLEDISDTSQRSIMEAINKYLDDGDTEALEAAIKIHQPQGWINYLYHKFYRNKADITLEMIQKLNKSGTFSRAIKKISATTQGNPTADIDQLNINKYDYLSYKTTQEMVQKRIRRQWAEYTVPKDTYAQILEKMRTDLNKIKTGQNSDAYKDIPKIEYKSLFPEDTTHSNHPKTMIEHIEEEIEQCLEAINDDKPATLYQTQCGELQIKINDMLNYRYQNDTTDRLIEQKESSAYNNIGKLLIDNNLHRTPKTPTRKESIKVSVASVLAKIEDQIKITTKISELFIKIKSNLEVIQQNDFINDINEFSRDCLAKRVATLNTLKTSMLLLDEKDEIDIMNATSVRDLKILKTMDTIFMFSEDDFLGTLSKLLTYDKHNKERVYKKVDGVTNGESKFNEVMTEITKYNDTNPNDDFKITDTSGEVITKDIHELYNEAEKAAEERVTAATTATASQRSSQNSSGVKLSKASSLFGDPKAGEAVAVVAGEEEEEAGEAVVAGAGAGDPPYRTPSPGLGGEGDDDL